MRKTFYPLLALASFAFLASPASAAFNVTLGATENIQTNNDYKADLNALGLFRISDLGDVITLSGPGAIKFELLAYENGLRDTFSADGSTVLASWTGAANLFAAPLLLGTFDASVASPANWSFSGGVPGGVGSLGFGVFTPRGKAGAMFSTNVLYFGYDDGGGGIDDNHDDGIIRATFVPEPTTWAMLIVGFGMVGFSARRSRNTVLA